VHVPVEHRGKEDAVVRHLVLEQLGEGVDAVVEGGVGLRPRGDCVADELVAERPHAHVLVAGQTPVDARTERTALLVLLEHYLLADPEQLLEQLLVLKVAHAELHQFGHRIQF